MMRLGDEAVEATRDDEDAIAVQETAAALEVAPDSLGLTQSDEREKFSEISEMARNDKKYMEELGCDTVLPTALPAPPDESPLQIPEQQPVLSRPSALSPIAGIANTSSLTSDLTIATTVVAPAETTDRSDAWATEQTSLNDKTSELNDDTRLISTATEDTFDNAGHAFTLPVGRTNQTTTQSSAGQ
jgi:hypothetical protein